MSNKADNKTITRNQKKLNEQSPKLLPVQLLNAMTDPTSNNPVDFTPGEKCILDAIKQLSSNIVVLEQKMESVDSRMEEVTAKISNMEMDINNNFDKIYSEIDDIKSSVVDNSDDLERFKREKDIKVNGIPYFSKENTNDLYEKLCRALGYESTPIADVFRAGKNSRSPILIKFLQKKDKINFFKKYLLSNTEDPLTLRKLDAESDDRIYISENLTNRNYKILKAALALKKEGVIFGVHTYDGLVSVKINESDKEFQTLTSHDQIKKLCSKSRKKTKPPHSNNHNQPRLPPLTANNHNNNL